MGNYLNRDDFKIVKQDDYIKYYKNGVLHRDEDEPAVIYPSGVLEYYKNGKLHRDNNKPAKIYNNGDKEYYKNGELHRDDGGPAKDLSHKKVWYQNGKIKRDGDKPDEIIYYINNVKQIWHNDNQQWHRINGPAVIDSHGNKEWRINGRLHNIDGPALIKNCKSEEFIVYCEKKLLNVRKFIDCENEYYYNGNLVSQKWLKENRDKIYI
jgi:hypothetical protein